MNKKPPQPFDRSKYAKKSGDELHPAAREPFSSAPSSEQKHPDAPIAPKPKPAKADKPKKPSSQSQSAGKYGLGSIFAKDTKTTSPHKSPNNPPHRPSAGKASKPKAAPKQANSPVTATRKLIHRLRHATEIIDHVSDRLVPINPEQDQTNSPEQMARPMLVRGMWLTVVVLGSIVAFAGLYPLATGAIAPGKLVVDSNRKEIQHLEGGIVKDILVKEGESVKAGDVLVQLDTTVADAQQGLVFGQMIAARATEARLIAERDNLDRVTFPEKLLTVAKNNAETKAAIDAQQRLFASRKKANEGQAKVLDQKIAQTAEEINGLKQQISAATSQIRLLEDEIGVVRKLLASGNAARPRLLALERQQAALQGERGQARALISRANQTINEAKIEKINLQTKFLNEVVAELKQTQVEISNLEEQERTSDDYAKRTFIKSPINGEVTGLSVFTKGGVVKPGETIMTIVPSGDKLIVEARLSPLDIDVVHQGLKAHVRFLSLSTRQISPVEGTVITVSADRFDDPQTGEAYYTSRIEIPKEALDSLGDKPLTPGMPIEALIVTGSRTFLSYLFRPIGDSFNRAFRQE